ncbi:hypothetical protein ACQPXM_09265 [Kribbella sp. CA-253562]|uniref:hypothetical protein n=1 Tax=Kribbella sp. CA-253562 TaxID=3239942 RepID=UPI003D94B877
MDRLRVLLRGVIAAPSRSRPLRSRTSTAGTPISPVDHRAAAAFRAGACAGARADGLRVRMAVRAYRVLPELGQDDAFDPATVSVGGAGYAFPAGLGRRRRRPAISRPGAGRNTPPGTRRAPAAPPRKPSTSPPYAAVRTNI